MFGGVHPRITYLLLEPWLNQPGGLPAIAPFSKGHNFFFPVVDRPAWKRCPPHAAHLYSVLVQTPSRLPQLDAGVRKAVAYLMGLNMAFPKSENLRTSLRWTPLGFTTVRGRREREPCFWA